MCKQYGECFAVLNMANAYCPGGGYLEAHTSHIAHPCAVGLGVSGAGAMIWGTKLASGAMPCVHPIYIALQGMVAMEENMFRRTDCHFQAPMISVSTSWTIFHV